MLFIRKSYSGLRDFEQTTRELFVAAYGSAATYSQNDHIWRLPTGAFFELAQLECHADLQKFAGRSFQVIFVDESGQFPSPELPDLLRANLRGPKGVPTRMVLIANPGNAGQTWLARRFVLGRAPWTPFQDERGDWWALCPSVYTDNPHIDAQAYRAQLEAACQTDPELLKAWLSGSFVSATGSYFGLVLDERRNACGPFEPEPPSDEFGRAWRTWLSVDHGTAAPTVALLLAESPGGTFGGQFFPRGSVIALDEYTTARTDDPNRGSGATVAAVTDAILTELCQKWGVRPMGVLDDACFARTGHGLSLADEYARAGLALSPARKADRVSGWQRLRRYMADAGTDKPGLYISRSCSYLWQTLPFLPRDPRRPEDLDSSAPDHGADALRYGLLFEFPAMGRLDIPFAM